MFTAKQRKKLEKQSCNQFLDMLESQPSYIREHMLKAIDLYCKTFKTDIIDMQAISIWLPTLPDSTIAQSTLSAEYQLMLDLMNKNFPDPVIH